MQIASSRIWNRVADSISYEDTRYDTLLHKKIMYTYLLRHKQGTTQNKFSKLSKAGLNTESSFSLISCHTKVKERSLPYFYL